MGKKKTPTAAKEESKPPSFEDALGQLDQIVRDLEDGSVGLEESMQRFETGIGLLRTCHKILENAEQNIELLTGFDADGNPVSTAFDTTATAQQSKATAGKRKSASHKSKTANEDGDDATLF